MDRWKNSFEAEEAKGRVLVNNPRFEKCCAYQRKLVCVASAARVIRVVCETAACTAACGQDEVLVSAYCGPGRAAVTIANERSVSCPRRAATSALVAVCAKVQSQ